MSARYIVAQGHRIHLGGERFLNPGDEYTPPTPSDVVRLAECLIRINAPVQPEDLAPADPAPVEATRPSRSRKAAPVPAVPPAADDAPASEVG